MPDAPSLPVWLRAQIERDRQLAKRARFSPQTKTSRSRDWALRDRSAFPGGVRPYLFGVEAFDEQGVGVFVANGVERGEHIERWDPTAVMADLDAKLRIVDLHSGGHECSGYDHRGETDNCRYVHDFELCSTLRLLAVPYAGRAGYLETWRPE